MKRCSLLCVVAFSMAAQAASAPPVLDWSVLRGLNYKTGQIRDDTKALDGTEVKMPGFMVPFDDSQRQEVSEFLFVNIAGACVHVPPPPPNQIVLVKMADGKKAKVFWQEPVWVVGKIFIEAGQSPYGGASYRMVATSVEFAKGF